MANGSGDGKDHLGILAIAATVAGLGAYMYVLGGAVTWVRLSAAHLPADFTTALLDPHILLTIGVRVLIISAAVFTVLSVLAYAVSSPSWSRHERQWRRHLLDDVDDVDPRPLGERLRAAWQRVRRRAPGRGGENVPAKDADTAHRATPAGARPPDSGGGDPPGAERARDERGDPAILRTVAGFQILVLAGILALGAASTLESSIPSQAVAVVAVVVVFATVAVFAWRGEKLLSHRRHHWLRVVILIAALFFQLPVALLIIGLLAFAAFGRVIARIPRPRSLAEFFRSPLVWVLAGMYAVVALVFVATPPVTYPRALVQTASGQRVGGYLTRTDDGVYLATCTAKSDGHSTAERVELVRQDAVQQVTVGGQPYRLDSGDRPSLLAVLLRPFGLHPDLPVVLRVELRALQPVCDAAELASGGLDKGLGAGALTDPDPPHAAPPGGEPAIEAQAPHGLAQLARKYQPTVETTVADRFWPVSVASVLAERGPADEPVCLVIDGTCETRRPALSDLTSSGSPNDYLDLPAPLAGDPTQQFLAFARGQRIDPDAARGWLSNPAALHPWDTAQLYFYYAGPADGQKRYGDDRTGTIALQYWFFYPYNYYPTRVEGALMESAPLAGDRVNTDLHEGDWEHVVVLLDAASRKPRSLYLARHDTEGVTIPWTSSKLSFDGTHPIVQGAFGGHPSYVNTCGGFPRARLNGQSSDWVVCGTGRYAFPAATTPLVDLAHASWACWPGHFGEAKPLERTNAAIPDFQSVVWKSKLLKVAGPQSPLRQAENAGVCDRDPLAPERAF